MISFCSAEKPVVPITIDFSQRRAASKVLMLDSGVVKSMTTSQSASASSTLSTTEISFFPIPASSPISLPIEGCPACSVPPERLTPCVSSTHATMVFPILPPAPITTTLINFSPYAMLSKQAFLLLIIFLYLLFNGRQSVRSHNFFKFF